MYSPLGPLCEGAPPAGGVGENCAVARNISGYGKVLSLRPFGAPPSQREVFDTLEIIKVVGADARIGSGTARLPQLGGSMQASPPTEHFFVFVRRAKTPPHLLFFIYYLPATHTDFVKSPPPPLQTPLKRLQW